MTSSQTLGDIDMGTIAPTKSNLMLECNCAREEFGSSKILNDIDKITKKILTYVEAIHEDKIHKDIHNWDHLWGIANTLFYIMEENENEAKESMM